MAVIDPPAALRSAQISIMPRDRLAETRRAYSGEEDRIDFGGEWWELTLVTPPMMWDDAADVAAWCDRLRDGDAFARIAVPAIAARRGSTSASVVTVAANVDSLQRAVAVSGLGAGATLLAGSFLTTATGRLHRLRQSVTADGAGAATLDLFPRLREALAPGVSLQVGAPTGLWRLQGRPGHDWSVQQFGRLVAPKTMTFIEALA